MLDPTCAVANSTAAGPARPLWHIDPSWIPPNGAGAVVDTAFTLAMDGVRVGWTWDSVTGTYLRSQDDQPHLAAAGAQIAARNVVELSTAYVPSPVDARSPTPITVGTGTAVVHRNGSAIPTIWSRETPYDSFAFVDTATDQPIPPKAPRPRRRPEHATHNDGHHDPSNTNRTASALPSRVAEEVRPSFHYRGPRPRRAG